jgi:hypothetical protein
LSAETLVCQTAGSRETGMVQHHKFKKNRKGRQGIAKEGKKKNYITFAETLRSLRFLFSP